MVGYYNKFLLTFEVGLGSSSVKGGVQVEGSLVRSCRPQLRVVMQVETPRCSPVTWLQEDTGRLVRTVEDTS